MSFLTRFRRWVRGSAAVLDPHESDIRAVGPEASSVVEHAAPPEPTTAEPASPEHISPDAKDLGREHRAY